MRIIIDAMGGDHAPDEIVKGACSVAGKSDVNITLVGNTEAILRCIEQNRADKNRFDIVEAQNVISMEDDPLSAVRKKKDSSMIVALKLLADGKGDALVSAGNTGALFSGATLIVKRAEGVKRTAIGTLLPGTKPCLLLDAGANVTVTEDYLCQFAVIGSIYMRKLYGIKSPRVGVLNNGTEECKGTSLQIETGKRLRADERIHFIGNVEASTMLTGACDVAVCDGFTGNIFLKAIEGMGKWFFSGVKEVYSQSLLTKLSYIMVRGRLSMLRARFDPSAHGGSPILGIAKPVIKAHGSSNATAFANAILQAIRYADSGMCEEIEKEATLFAGLAIA